MEGSQSNGMEYTGSGKIWEAIDGSIKQFFNRPNQPLTWLPRHCQRSDSLARGWPPGLQLRKFCATFRNRSDA